MSDSHPPAVLFERRPDHVALVTLNRPAARNAVHGDVARALDAIIKQTEARVKEIPGSRPAAEWAADTRAKLGLQ